LWWLLESVVVCGGGGAAAGEITIIATAARSIIPIPIIVSITS
jgi:hypothetical protein